MVTFCFVYLPPTKLYLQVSLQTAFHAHQHSKSIIFGLKSFKTKPTYTPHGGCLDGVFYRQKSASYFIEP
jgi:hypothetical protein